MLPSLAIFSPQSKEPQKDYLDTLRLYAFQKPDLQPLIQAIEDLPIIWSTFSGQNEAIAHWDQGAQYAKELADWMKYGHSAGISSIASSIVSLPLLLLIQIVQYFQFLEMKNINHFEMLTHLRSRGGIQGYCGGMLAGIAIACSVNEAEVVMNASKALQFALVIGGYSELENREGMDGPTSIVVRLEHEGQGEELVQKYKDAYLSAITDPRTVSIVGTAKSLKEIQSYVRDRGMQTQTMHITGKVHNPENSELAKQLYVLFDESNVELPNASELRVPFRSNITGEVLQAGSLTHEVIDTILLACCHWYQLLCGVSQDLAKTGHRSHVLATFGIGSCTSLTPFHQAGLQITKLDVLSFVKPLMPSVSTHILEDRIACTNHPANAVAVIGMACRFPGANNIEELWDLISSGESTLKKASHERVDFARSFRASQDEWTHRKEWWGNFIEDMECFDNSFFGISPREAASMDPQQRILLETAYQAIESSGYLGLQDPTDSVGVFLGSSLVDYLDNTSAHAPTAHTSTGTLRAFLSGRISNYFQWSGPSETLDTACSSSLVAINRACRAIEGGECSLALAGGVNLISSPSNYLDLGRAGFLSPTGQCKPFDEKADGYCRSEGAGIVFLKSLSRAIADEDQIFGTIIGVSTNYGGFLVPKSSSQTQLYRRTLSQAQVRSDQVSYIEAHGTGTQAGDPVEISSLREVFGDPQRLSANPLYLGSIKGNIGHCESAAGVAGLLKALLMVNKGYIPPMASHKSLNQRILALDPDGIVIPSSLTRWSVSPRIALVNSYGAAGSNSAVLLRQPQNPIDSHVALNDDGGKTYPIILSARSEYSLFAAAADLLNYLESRASSISISDLAFTLAEKRERHSRRWTSSQQSIQGLIESLQSGLRPTVAQNPKKVVLTFSGQSKTSVGLDKRLYASCRLFRQYVNKCDEQLIDLGYSSVLPTIFDHKDICKTKLVEFHCGIFTVQYACAMSWIKCGLCVDAVIGHSIGELTAMAVSGILSLKDALKLVAARASLVKTHWGPELGAMLLIKTDIQTALDIVSTSPADDENVEIACYNSPTSQVIVGSEASVSHVEENMNKPDFRSMKCYRLNITHGFHSRLTESILRELSEVAKSVDIQPPTIPIEHCTLQHSAVVRSEHITRHTRDPVFFCQAVRRIEKQLGPSLWLEAGVDSGITSMVQKAVRLPDIHSFQGIKSDRQNPLSSFCIATSNLWREGILVSFLGFHEARAKQIWLPPYRFQRLRHWITAVDHAYELQKPTTVAEAKVAVSDQSAALIVPRSKENGDFQFFIDTKCQGFVALVSGHAVLSRPLCPAALFMNCAAMATCMIVDRRRVHGQALSFKDVKFQSPLGIDPSAETFVVLTEDVRDVTWSFQINSIKSSDRGSKTIVHALGMLTFDESTHLQGYQTSVRERISAIRGNSAAQCLDRKQAYALFSRIVFYSDAFQGISSISIDGDRAIAAVELSDTVKMIGSSATDTFMTTAMDNFLQVAGLMINSGTHCPNGQVFLATGTDNVFMSADLSPQQDQPLTVYATVVKSDGTRAICDVFVISKSGSLVATITGIHFTRLSTDNLEMLLDSANQEPTPNLMESDIQLSASQTPTSNTPDSEPKNDHTSHKTSASSETSLVSELDENISYQPIDAVKNLVGSYVGLADANFSQQSSLADLGVDSLAAIELASEISRNFNQDIASSEVLTITFGELCLRLSGKKAALISPADLDYNTDELKVEDSALAPQITIPSSERVESDVSIIGLDPIETLKQCDEEFDNNARKFGFTSFWTKIAPFHDELVVAYIGEQFLKLGVDLYGTQAFDVLSSIKHLKKHSRLVRRLWDILLEHHIVIRKESKMIRSSKSMPKSTAEAISNSLILAFPKYSCEYQLLAITAPHLAEGLIGEVDHIRLLFSSPYSQNSLREFYTNSPQFATASEQLIMVLDCLTKSIKQGKLRVLEVGAGFGGTTTRLLESLEVVGFSIEYTFTDASALLVSKARESFGKLYPWMDFQVLDLEKPPPNLLGLYDVIIGTNVVHATTNIVSTCRRLRSLLRTNGFILLSEITRIVNWYDLVFGLVDGWWCFSDGRNYPLQSADKWARDLKEAGFENVGYSTGSSQESLTQQLVVGSTKRFKDQAASKRLSMDGNVPSYCNFQTLPYKIVDGTGILADIYFPRHLPSEKKMPIALMVHGGGFMTLSRKAIRPLQTQFLLDHDVIPVSIDYRLCPEIDIINGPIADVRDAVIWARTALPTILHSYGILADSRRIVIIGWSTGGYLAMTTAWTCQAIGQEPPLAILSFYAPTDLCSQALGRPEIGRTPEPTMSLHDIQDSLSPRPISSHVPNITEPEVNSSWLKFGNSRSELVLHFFKATQDRGLQLLLNGISSFSPSASSNDISVSQHLIDMISPIVQVQNGTYRVPTYIIHPDQDEIAPYADAVSFVQILKSRGIKAGLLKVENKGHLYDLRIKPGERIWDKEILPGYEFLFRAMETQQD